MTQSEFEELCLLARLDPKDDSLINLRNDFDRIIEYVNKIAELDTTSMKDDIDKNELQNVFRSDSSKPALGVGAIANIAPDWESGHFVVPGAIESEG